MHTMMVVRRQPNVRVRFSAIALWHWNIGDSAFHTLGTRLAHALTPTHVRAQTRKPRRRTDAWSLVANAEVAAEAEAAVGDSR